MSSGHDGQRSLDEAEKLSLPFYTVEPFMETSLNLMVARTVSKYLGRLGGWKVVDHQYGQTWDEKSEGQMHRDRSAENPKRKRTSIRRLRTAGCCCRASRS